jgi:SMODS-associated and fused to various effectors sensor domain
LYKDGLTQKRSNLAITSHIVAFSPDGPRGDPYRSKQLEKAIANLMLTCRDHGKIIDDKTREDDYPEHLLLEFKREHEQRIRLLTESREDAQTHVLLLQAPIDGQDVAINATDAFRAILPQYPAEEDAMLIDLSGTELRADTAGFFPLMAQSITARVSPLLRRHAGQPRIKSLSIFALAPIPLLVHFGSLLGDMHRVDLYQRHRDRQDWTWGEEEEAGAFYEVLKPDSVVNNGQEAALVLSISEPVVHARVQAALGSEPIVYEIRAREPSRDFLTSRKRLEMFGYEVRKLLYEFRIWHEHHRVVHLFAAVPAPVAIEFGRSLKEFDPPFLVYEYQKGTHTLVPALVVNDREKKSYECTSSLHPHSPCR